jgi:hypothetical protein
MGIWPLAEKLTQLHCCEGRADTEYIIESFKSYEGIEDWQPVARPAFVLISASTSGGLEQRIREHLNPAPVDVITLIRLKSDEEKSIDGVSRILFELPRKLAGAPAFNDMRSEFVSAAKAVPLGDESIQISGERFLSRYAKPRLVRLIYTALSEPVRKELAQLALKHTLYAGQLKFDSSGRWSITFDGELTQRALTSRDNGAVESLLESWLRNHAFPGPVAIVYPAAGGSASREVAASAETAA